MRAIRVILGSTKPLFDHSMPRDGNPCRGLADTRVAGHYPFLGFVDIL